MSRTVAYTHIVESNFGTRASDRFLEWETKYNVQPFQIQCRTEGETLRQRFQQRAASAERHPGHIDQLQIEELKDQLLKGSYEPQKIGGELFEVDTTDFSTVDYDGLLRAIKLVG